MPFFMIKNLILATMMTTTVGTTAFRDTPQNTNLQTFYQEQTLQLVDENWRYFYDQDSEQEQYYNYFTYSRARKTNNQFPNYQEVAITCTKEINYYKDSLEDPPQTNKNVFVYGLIKFVASSTINLNITQQRLLGNSTTAINQYTTTIKVTYAKQNDLSAQQMATLDSYIYNNHYEEYAITPQPAIVENTLYFDELSNANNDITDINITAEDTLSAGTTAYIYFKIQLQASPENANNVTIYRSNEVDYIPQTLYVSYDYTLDMDTIENYEVVSIPEILFSILTMPFAFISSAFNLTLFPGTPYSINITNIIWAILTALIFIFIIKKVLK